MKKLLSICYNFPPEPRTTSNRIARIMKYLQKDWQIEVITPVEDGYLGEEIAVHSVKNWYPKSLIDLLIKLKLEKLLEWVIPFWGEPAFFWVAPALNKARKLIKQERPDVIVAFMMPYSIGIIGVITKWLTGLPLVLNFDDSPTCDDMHSGFYSWFHYRLTLWMENFYVHQADAVIYVSRINLERVRSRQPQQEHSKFHLVRYGADPEEFSQSPARTDNEFHITYTGAMAGWFEFYYKPGEKTCIKKIYQAWVKLGHYQITKLDQRSASPMFVGQAVQQVLINYPEWEGKIKIKIYGNLFAKYVVDRALQNQNLTNIVSVSSPVSNEKSIELACQCDLLFLTLPARPPGSCPGGRISGKTYEYLMTDRPILAAVPKGENWDYLEGKPGVWLVEPTDVSTMIKVISKIAAAKFSGKQLTFDRTHLYDELSYVTRAKEFSDVLDKAIYIRQSYPKIMI